MTTVKDIYRHLDTLAPFDTQIDSDNSGLLVGDARTPVTKVLLALDVTEGVAAQAAALGAELIIAHHPVIFQARKHLLAGDPVYALARRGTACIAWHTPLDAATGGVSDVLADALGLRDIEPLHLGMGVAPLGRLGMVEPMRAADLAALATRRLGAAVRYCDAGRRITRVAVCGGGGASFLGDLDAEDVDAYVTGDAAHHNFLDALQAGITLLAAGHYETEHPVVPVLAGRLRTAFPAVQFIIAEEPCPVMTVTP